uniref:Uncharacterized protein n=1 Tax=Ditylenchus dipsaci TaxID=166011 RepID=A0A915DBQ7_9BILA
MELPLPSTAKEDKSNTLKTTLLFESMAITEIFSRLPTFAKPLLYNLQLKPCLANSRCEGRVTIDLEITQPTSYLKLHSAEIDIKSATLQLENGCMFTELPFLLEHKPMFVTFTLPNEVDAQKARLEIVFVARLTDKTMGFCRYSFTDASAAKKLLAFTQFESTYARKAFPCWDEPEYKAKFTVSLEVDEHMTALSNMPAVAELKLEATGKKITKSKSGIDIRVYTTLGKQYLGEFALEVAGKSIDWYTEWFAMESPLTKCDLLAVPSFAPGAMENWGLVIAREPILFMDSMKSSIQSKIDVSLAVSHEIAHFWFGNLVTMFLEMVDDLWLNEGFANWIMNEALTIDNPDKLEDVFDAVTCCKPSSLIQMLSTYLGASVFQKGLRDYVQKHKFANSTADDLWTAVSEASNQNVNEIMESWTNKLATL